MSQDWLYEFVMNLSRNSLSSFFKLNTFCIFSNCILDSARPIVWGTVLSAIQGPNPMTPCQIKVNLNGFRLLYFIHKHWDNWEQHDLVGFVVLQHSLYTFYYFK
ncbi:hypothetical protein XENTR_v10002656 [Xenopus tropicalis]|nr:hypothetical protein XENTR_v10002656 [Xenopus tropicalis]